MPSAFNGGGHGAGGFRHRKAARAILAAGAVVALAMVPAAAFAAGGPAGTGLRGFTADLDGTPSGVDPLVTTDPAADPFADPDAQSGTDATPTPQNTTAASSGTDDAARGTVTRVPAVSASSPASDRNELGRINLRQRPIGQFGAPPPAAPLDQAPGISVGTFTLRPELTQSIGAESQKLGGGRENRTYSQTALRGTLTSDWSRNALTITGSGIFQKNISGSGETEPSADISADLRLDLAPETTADLTAGYDFYRESVSDPNAVAGALNQSKVNTFTGGVALSRQLGILRGNLSAKAIRTTYGDVELSDGSTLSQADRDALAGEFAARVGYQLSPAITPFLQAKYRRTAYDQRADSAGYRRSSDTYTTEAGVAADFGEKLSGEVAAGYILRSFEDDRLSDVGGLAVDATGKWSPRRGTDLSLGLVTQIEDSTTPGQSGPITYALNAEIDQTMRDNLVAKLGASYLYRAYDDAPDTADQQVYAATVGLSWYLTRYLSLDGNLSFERTRQKGTSDQDIATVDVGLTVRR